MRRAVHFRRLLMSIAVCTLMQLGRPFAAHAEAPWTQPTPEELAMTSEPKAPGASAIYLYREEVSDDARHSKSVYVRMKILTDAGRSNADVTLDYVNAIRFNIVKVEGRTIHKDGRIIPFTGKPFERVVEKERGYKVLEKAFTLPDVEAGSILEYRYELSYSFEWKLKPQWSVQRSIFIRREHFLWKTQDEEPVAWTSILPGGAQVQMQSGGVGAFKSPYRNFELTVTDVPAIVDEPFQPPPDSFAYHVNFYYTEAANQDEYWQSVGRLWSLIVENFISPPAKMNDALQTLVAPGDSDTVKLQKIYTAVMGMENTRFTRDRDEQEDRAAKLKPISTTLEIWQRRRGSNDQLTCLFVALARAAGMKAYIMKVTSRDRNFFSPKWLSLDQLDDFVAIVVVDGKDRLFDPGQRYCPFGQLSWMHSNATGIRQLDAGATEISSTPPLQPDMTTIYRMADLKLAADGTVQGTMKLMWSGVAALEWRQMALNGDAASMRTAMQHWVEKQVPAGMEVAITDVGQFEEYEQPLTAFFTVHGQLGSATAKHIVLPSQFFQGQGKPLFAADTRNAPVYFHFQDRVIDAVRLKFPVEFTVESIPPPDSAAVQQVLAYSSSAELQSGAVIVHRKLDIGKLLFQKTEYFDLRNFFNQVAADDAQPVVLLRQANAK